MGGHQRMGGDRSAAPREQASRRRMVAALVGGGFTGALGRDESAAKKRRKKRRRTSCELGCTVSTCNRLPAGCSLFPTDTIWNTAIDALPRDARSDAYVASIGADRGLHADFEAGFYRGQPIGIPFVVVPSARPLAPITFAAYGDESDPGPYPAPPDAPRCPDRRRTLFRRRPARPGRAGRRLHALRALCCPAAPRWRVGRTVGSGPRPMRRGCRSPPGCCAMRRSKLASSRMRCASRRR